MGSVLRLSLSIMDLSIIRAIGGHFGTVIGRNPRIYRRVSILTVGEPLKHIAGWFRVLTAKEATLNFIISLVAQRVLFTSARDAYSPVACEIVNVIVDITWLHQLGICVGLLHNAAHIALAWVG